MDPLSRSYSVLIATRAPCYIEDGNYQTLMFGVIQFWVFKKLLNKSKEEDVYTMSYGVVIYMNLVDVLIMRA